MAGEDRAGVTPAGIREGRPEVLRALVAARGSAVLAYCRAVTAPDLAPRAAAEAFARFRAAVVDAPDLSAVDPDALLLGATRHAAASLARTVPAVARTGRREDLCAAVPGMLAARASGVLGDDERTRLESHLARCPGCRGLAEDVERAEEAYRTATPAPVPPAMEAMAVTAMEAAAPVAAPTTPASEDAAAEADDRDRDVEEPGGAGPDEEPHAYEDDDADEDLDDFDDFDDFEDFDEGSDRPGWSMPRPSLGAALGFLRGRGGRPPADEPWHDDDLGPGEAGDLRPDDPHGAANGDERDPGATAQWDADVVAGDRDEPSAGDDVVAAAGPGADSDRAPEPGAPPAPPEDEHPARISLQASMRRRQQRQRRDLRPVLLPVLVVGAALIVTLIASGVFGGDDGQPPVAERRPPELRVEEPVTTPLPVTVPAPPPAVAPEPVPQQPSPQEPVPQQTNPGAAPGAGAITPGATAPPEGEGPPADPSGGVTPEVAGTPGPTP